MLMLLLTTVLVAFMWILAVALSGRNRDGPTFREPWRPQLHFSPPENWMNDPNGLTFFDGTYHLYFQYDEDGSVGGPNLDWGHAVGKDNLHWDYEGVAIRHTKQFRIFSGSAIHGSPLGPANGRDSKKPLVAIYSGDYYYEWRENQHLQVSRDGGTTFAPDPVILDLGPNIADFRDPKVIWYPDNGGFWLMSVARSDHQFLLFYRSHNASLSGLLNWTRLSSFDAPGMHEIGAQWECPNLVRIGTADANKYLLFVSADNSVWYLLGNFDGVQFVPDEVSQRAEWTKMDYGPDFYASQAFYFDFDGDNAKDPIVMSWMSRWTYGRVVPTDKWRGSQNLPRIVSLGSDGRIRQNVVPEVTSLRLRKSVNSDFQVGVAAVRKVEFPFVANLIEVLLAPAMPNADFELWFHLAEKTQSQQRTVLSFANRRLCFNRSLSGNTPTEEFRIDVYCSDEIVGGVSDIRVFVDWASVEVFVNGGAVTLTGIVFPLGDPTKNFAIRNLANAAVTFKTIEVYELESIHSS